MAEVKHCQVSTTTDSKEAAAELARSAVEARLAACGQVVGPIDSVYWWEGKVDTAAEWLVVFKTTTDRSDRLVEHLRSRHSYDVPEIIITPITGGDPAYLSWVRKETRTIPTVTYCAQLTGDGDAAPSARRAQPAGDGAGARRVRTGTSRGADGRQVRCR
jgi:periplasmic divalent cation tolerance protein